MRRPGVRRVKVTAAEKAYYAGTEVCRVFGFIPAGWRWDEDGLSLVLQRTEERCRLAKDAAGK